MGVAFVKALQGDDPKYRKVDATAKHYAVHSGPEHDRHVFDVHPSERDLWETYLPAFRALVQEGKVASVMGAYNRVNGESASGSHRLLTDILRNQWGFNGYVVSDCDSVDDIWKFHKIVATPEEAAALGVKSGDEVNCGRTYAALFNAVHKGLITEAEIDVARAARVPDAVPARHVRSAGESALGADSLQGESVARARRAGAQGRAGIDRAAQEQRHAAARQGEAEDHRGDRPDGRRDHVLAGQLLRHAGRAGHHPAGHSRRGRPEHARCCIRAARTSSKAARNRAPRR